MEMDMTTPEQFRALADETTAALEIISKLCRDGRPPKMSIPVRQEDEDIVLCDTLMKCAAALREAAATQEMVEREERLLSEGWHMNKSPDGRYIIGLGGGSLDRATAARLAAEQMEKTDGV